MKLQMCNAASRNYAENLGLAVVILLTGYIILLYMSLGRPIWFDEFLHFAVAAESSSGEAWSLIRRSILDINHNQTGIYMMLDFWLEKLCGANAFLLRFPSILCGFLFFIFSIRLFKVLKYSSIWIFLALIALAGQRSVLYYLGEARPYFPLAAAVLGTLVYYLTNRAERYGWSTFLGWLAVIIGCLFHPYFIAYWGVIILITFFYSSIENSTPVRLLLLISHVNLKLCVTGASIYFVLAMSTWLRHGRSFNMDPFEYVKPSIWIHFADYMHFQFISSCMLSTTLVTLVAIVSLIVMPHQKRGSIKGLITPLVLIIAMLLLSVLVGLVSYLKHYWIIPRQWVASAAIVPLAFVWLWAELGRIYSRFVPGAFLAVWIAAALAMFDQAQTANNELLESLIKYATIKQQVVSASCNSIPAPPSPVDDEKAAHMWVDLANQNIQCGQPVWPIFKAYYNAAAPKGPP